MKWPFPACPVDEVLPVYEVLCPREGTEGGLSDNGSDLPGMNGPCDVGHVTAHARSILSFLSLIFW